MHEINFRITEGGHPWAGSCFYPFTKKTPRTFFGEDFWFLVKIFDFWRFFFNFGRKFLIFENLQSLVKIFDFSPKFSVFDQSKKRRQYATKLWIYNLKLQPKNMISAKHSCYIFRKIMTVCVETRSQI